MFGWVSKIKAWLTSFLDNTTRDKVLALILNLQGIVDAALPLVKNVDVHLKALLKKQLTVEEMAATVKEFLSSFGVTVSDVEAEKIAALPLGDLCLHVVLNILQAILPKSPAVSVLRLAIEVAYNIYKSAKGEELET